MTVLASTLGPVRAQDRCMVRMHGGRGFVTQLPGLHNGELPLGRWPATAAEVAGRFVEGQSPHRAKLWDDWRRLTSALQGAIGKLAAAWLSGSFFTEKEVPGDVDCLYIIDIDVVLAARHHPDPRVAQLFQVVANNETKATFGLSVDTFVLTWTPTPGVLRPAHAETYLQDRGYWDDLWSRQRSTGPREDSLPRRGYVEVIIDGYS